MKSTRAAIAATIILPALLLGGCIGQSEESFIASGKEYLEKNDAKAAVLQFKSALQKNDSSAVARLLLGKALLAGGDPVAAVVELRKARDLKASEDDVVPALARAMLATGDSAKLIAQYGDLRLKDEAAAADLRTSVATAHVWAGHTDQAHEAVRLALLAQPTYAPALILRARLLAVDKDYDGALAVLDQVITHNPADDRAGVFKGELLRQTKNDEAGAMQAFRKVLATSPNSLPAHVAVVALLFEQGKFAEAKPQIEQLRKLAPNHPETLFFLAQSALADKNYEAVRGHTETLLKIAPDNARVLELAGVAEYRLGNLAQAALHFGRAVKLNPSALQSRQLLAQIFIRGGQPDKVIELMQPVLDGDKPDAVSLGLAGEAYLQLGDAKRSEEAYQRATRAAPDNPLVRTAAAMAQSARGNAGVAIAELEKIAAADTGSRADLGLISARLRSNDLAGALKAIDGLEKKMPDDPLAYNLRGRVLLLKRDIPAATAAFEKSLSKDSKYFPAIASLAAIEMSAGKPDAARKRFEAVVKSDPGHIAARLALAEVAMRSGASKEDVTALIREAVKAKPTDPSAWVVLVNHHLATGDSKAAMAAAQEAAATLPNDLAVMDAVGRAQFASGNAQQSVSTFKKLAALQPSNAMHLARLADSQVAAQDLAGATLSLKRALELQPGLVPARRGLATVALMDKRPADALAIARDLQKSEPKSGVGALMEGDAHVYGKKWDLAAASYATSLQREKLSTTAVKLHNALVSGGKNAEADRMAADWLRDNPKDAGFRYYLGDAALSRGDYAGAESHYRSVVEVQPGNALALNNIAWLLVKQGKPGGVAMAQKALELLPDRAPLLDTLATALAAENQLPKAIEMQKRALQRNPDEPALRLNLAKLYIKSGDSPSARAELEALARLGSRFGGQAEVATLLKSL